MTNDPFGFELRSTRSEKDTLLSTVASDIVISDKYLQIDLQVPSQRIYGLGERNRQFTLSAGTWTMWANGQASPYDNGQGGLQTYGVHPFALIQTQIDGEFIGLYFRNSNAASPVIRHKKGQQGVRPVVDFGATISYITTGGDIEIYVFVKGDAKQIIKAYQNFVGKPSLPPFWALGWHATTTADPSTNIGTVKSMVSSYASAGIPLEGIWLDVPYMSNYTAFTVDQTNFAGLAAFKTQLYDAGQKLVVIVGPGLPAGDKTNVFYTEALQANALIKSTINPDATQGSALTSQVWPDVVGTGYETVFLDMFSPDASKIWHDGLTELYANVPFDGLWLDMNEATGVCNGECPTGKKSEELFEKNPVEEENFFGQPEAAEQFVNNTWYSAWTAQSEPSTYKLPFIPGSKNLDTISLSLNATHPSNGLNQIDVHSLFGHLEGKVTKEWFDAQSTLPVAL